jgi:hypothetical protein
MILGGMWNEWGGMINRKKVGAWRENTFKVKSVPPAAGFFGKHF